MKKVVGEKFAKKAHYPLKLVSKILLLQID